MIDYKIRGLVDVIVYLSRTEAMAGKDGDGEVGPKHMLEHHRPRVEEARRQCELLELKGSVRRCDRFLKALKPHLTWFELRNQAKFLREEIEEELGERQFAFEPTAKDNRGSTVEVDKLLSDLPGKVPDAAEKSFLAEALICFRNQAFRAAIVMTWNLTYFHLCHYILKHKLAEFNAQYPIRYLGKHNKAAAPVIKTYEDFSVDLKESEVIEMCKSAGIITKEQFKILARGLDRRNTGAHPSTTAITILQAEECIHDLITNVVLRITI